jgi:hypothetical protein
LPWGDNRSEKCVTMRIPTTITGIFVDDENVAQCLKYLCRLSIPVENISISGVKSSNLRVLARRLLAISPDKGRVINFLGLSGSIAGLLIILYALVLSPPWGQLRNLGMLGSLALGSILGYMCGTLIGCVVASSLSFFSRNVPEGRLAERKVAISVQITEQFPDKEAVRAIMQEFGAVVTLKEHGLSRPGKLDPPPFSPRSG